MVVYLLLWLAGGLELNDYPEVFASLQAAKDATGYEDEGWLMKTAHDGVVTHEPAQKWWPAPMIVERTVKE